MDTTQSNTKQKQPITIEINIPGERYVCSGSVVFSQLAAGLKSVDLPSGKHTLEIAGDGAILLDGFHVFTPRKSPSKAGGRV